MNPERWQKVDEIFLAALEREPGERAAFLDEACAGDESLRREVESLIASYERADSFIERPAAELLADDGPNIVAGQRIGHYEIINPLGEGGMGQVFLAEDTKLGRKIALKLLPAHFTKDADRLRRFQQEARAASALNHPNILTVHEMGQVDSVPFIVTEFIEGETLRERMTNSRMKVSESLEVAIQIASALAAAHEAGIVHRDIKPENIMVRRDGIIKVLDFGLAKLTEQRSVGSKATTRVNTEAGVVMGTAHYMSPEQARGQSVDARTDIWSLGVVLYEMAAGRAPFEGQTPSDVISSILHKEPAPLIRYSRETPEALEWIVAKALRKEREERYQTAKELLADLKSVKQRLEVEAELERSRQPVSQDRMEAMTSGGQPGAINSTPGAGPLVSAIKRRKTVAVVASGAVLIALAGIGFTLFKLIGEKQPERAAAPLRIAHFTSFPGREEQPAFSPDGNQIAFVWDGEKGDNRDIYVKLIGTGAPLRLTTNPADETSPAWSPDGRHIAFIRWFADRSEIYLVPALGGPERRLGESRMAGSDLVWNVSWSPDGQFLAVPDRSSSDEPFSIFLLSVDSGEKRKLTSPPAGFFGDSMTAFSPDGKTLAFVRWHSFNESDLYLISTAGGEARRLTSDTDLVEGLAWTADGREVVFELEGREGRSRISSLWRIPVFGGAPERLAAAGQGARSPAISRQGDRLAYMQSAEDTEDTNIWRLEVPGPAGRRRSPTRLISSTLSDCSPQYSPDGRRIAFLSDRSGRGEIWVCDSDGSNPIQLTNSDFDGSPRWSPGGRQIAFNSNQGGNVDIYVINAEGGKPRRLTTEPSEDVAPSWSRDGRWIYFGSSRSGSLQVWKVPAEGGQAVQVTRQGGFEGFESPDGGFFYYAKGRNVPGIWRIPVGGGEETPVLDLHGAGGWRYWAVVDRGIYFATAETPARPVIEFFNFATGRVTQIAALENPIIQWGAGLTVSPDGRWVLYTQVDQSGGDIMLVENLR